MSPPRALTFRAAALLPCVVAVIICAAGTHAGNAYSLRRSAAAVPPVVIIPGWTASSLRGRLDKPSVNNPQCEKKSDWFDLWVNIEQYLPPKVECFADNFKLEWNNTTQTYNSTPGVEVEAPGWGSTENFEFLDSAKHAPYATALVNALVERGWVRGVSLRGAPYDWRWSPLGLSAFYDKLRELVEDTYTLNGGQRVTILAHSMGGLHAQQFFSLQTAQWKDRFIARFMSLGTPYHGTAGNAKVIAGGIDHDFPGVSPLSMRPAQRTWESNMWMTPWLPEPQEDFLMGSIADRKYMASEIREFVADVFPEGLDGLDAVRKATAHRPAPNVEAHCLIGTQSKTGTSFHYATRNIDVEPSYEYGCGDGTVPTFSAGGCKAWSTQQSAPFTAVEYPGVTHGGLLNNVAVLDYVLGVLLPSGQ